jgi:hypothetical protein
MKRELCTEGQGSHGTGGGDRSCRSQREKDCWVNGAKEDLGRQGNLFHGGGPLLLARHRSPIVIVLERVLGFS